MAARDTNPNEYEDMLRASGMIDDGGPTESPTDTAGKPDRGNENEKPTKPSSLERLVDLVADQGWELLHDRGGQAYIGMHVSGHCETWPLGSSRVANELRYALYQTSKMYASKASLDSAIGILEIKAVREGPKKEVHVRLAEHDGHYYLDLCNEDWEVVEIDRDGWRIVPESPVRFMRPDGMLALPHPKRGGSLTTLRDLLNLPDEDSWHLVAGFLIGCFMPKGPYSVLVVTGEYGSAKSKLVEYIRGLVDPNSVHRRAPCKSEEDLMLAASSSWMVVYDNVSSLQPWHSDALCRVTSGGGTAMKRHYVQGVEFSMEVQCPVILNGIEDFVVRSDLTNRSLFVELQEIRKEHRRTERSLDPEYEAARPQLLGAVLDAVSLAIREYEEPDELPRLADLTAFVTAAEPALGWAPGTLADAIARNHASVNDRVLESSGLADVLRPWLRGQGPTWSGTASDLLAELRTFAARNMDTRAANRLPADPARLGGELRRIGPNLRQDGIHYEAERTSSKRMLRLWLTDNEDADSGDNTDDDAEPNSPPGDGEQPAGSGETAQPGDRGPIDPNTGEIIDMPW